MVEPIIRRALISVSDKTGMIDLVRFLTSKKIEILSTGGSAKAIRDEDLPVIEVSDYTGFPEMLDGRVKTLHPTIHGGILALRGNEDHEKSMKDNKIAPIDLVIVNLYPFVKTIEMNANFETCIENIDIGGPSLIRGAAKNHLFVTVVSDPADYSPLIEELKRNQGATTLSFRKKLAAKAFSMTGAYDSAIAGWFFNQNSEDFPENLTFVAKRQEILRYGENPHQKAALYLTNPTICGVARAKQYQGKELSYNNLNDTDAALELVSEFQEPAVAIIKHANPCGVAKGDSLIKAYKKALSCDPISAFGGVIALNQEIDEETAHEIIKLFTEVVIAPKATPEAIKIFQTKKNLRLLVTGNRPDPHRREMVVRSIAGGFLLQERDNLVFDSNDFQCVTRRKPTENEIQDLIFAFIVSKHVKSNAIIYAKNGMTVGIGAGQMSRIDSAKIASIKSAEISKDAGENKSRTIGSVVASDAFFPFADGLIAAAESGVTAVIQPGGSIRDQDVIEAANERNLAMIFTKMRHFKH
jgi:phosphoribosylaminoimidazolecarboxamide formyltransferase/IMP cyclohydrolase